MQKPEVEAKPTNRRNAALRSKWMMIQVNGDSPECLNNLLWGSFSPFEVPGRADLVNNKLIHRKKWAARSGLPEEEEEAFRF